MIQTINLSEFRDAFKACGRQEQFSYEGLGALFDFLEEFDGGGYELDVIALCCEYSEETTAQIADSYGLELPENETEEDHENATRAFLEAHTSIVAEVNGRFLFVNF